MGLSSGGVIRQSPTGAWSKRRMACVPESGACAAAASRSGTAAWIGCQAAPCLLPAAAPRSLGAGQRERARSQGFAQLWPQPRCLLRAGAGTRIHMPTCAAASSALSTHGAYKNKIASLRHAPCARDAQPTGMPNTSHARMCAHGRLEECVAAWHQRSCKHLVGDGACLFLVCGTSGRVSLHSGMATRCKNPVKKQWPPCHLRAHTPSAPPTAWGTTCSACVRAAPAFVQRLRSC